MPQAHRPHLPWHVPRKFWDMYPPTEEVALPKHETAPAGMPPIAFTYECDGKTSMKAFDKSAPIPYPNASTALPHNMTRSFRKGYHAAVSVIPPQPERRTRPVAQGRVNAAHCLGPALDLYCLLAPGDLPLAPGHRRPAPD